MDSTGDIIAGGGDYEVMKLAGTTGALLWRGEIEGDGEGSETAFAVKMVHSGDVVSAGTLRNSKGERDFAIVKMAGEDGHEMWRRIVTGGLDEDEEAFDIAVDENDDVVAVGRTSNPGGGRWDITVVKLIGESGEDFVADAESLLQSLIDAVVALDLDQGTERSLLAKLRAADRSLGDDDTWNDTNAIGPLKAFLNTVEAQSGKKIPKYDVEFLVESTKDLLFLLGVIS